MKSLLYHLFVKQLIILQYLCEQPSYLHYRPCPYPIFDIICTFFKLIDFALMSIHKLLINCQHRLYNKLEVPFLHTQLLRDCHQIEYLVKRVGPPDREVILQ